MTSAPRKVAPTYIQSETGNSNIRDYQARAAAQVYSTARNVLPIWTTSYWLSENEAPSSNPPSESSVGTDHSNTSTLNHTLPNRFAGFDVLRGRDVFVAVKDSSFTIYNVFDNGVDLEELCGYTCSNTVLSIKIIPNLDAEAPPKATILLQNETMEYTLSVVTLSTSLVVEHSIILPKTVDVLSLIACSQYIAIATPGSIIVYSLTLSTLLNVPVPTPIFAGSGRWLIYSLPRPKVTLTRSPILDTPPEARMYERVARGLTREVVSWGRETGEKIGEVISSYLNGSYPPVSEKPSPLPTHTGLGRHSTTLVIHDIPTNTILTQFQFPYRLGYLSISPSGSMLFCSPPKGDELFIYSLHQIPTEIHLLATLSRGYTYSRVIGVLWRYDNNCIGVISAHGTAHFFSLKRRAKDTPRAIGKIKIEGGVKGVMFLRRLERQPKRKTSTTKEDSPDILTVANMHERLTSWKVVPPQRTAMSLLTAYFNPEASDESLSVPIARPIANYILPSTHRELPFPSLITSPIIKAAFTNQKESTLDSTAKAELECSVTTRGIQGIRGIRLFEYTISAAYDDFGTPIPWTTKEIDLGMPRGQVRYFSAESAGSNSTKSLETPPSSEQDSPDLQPDNGKKKKRNRPAKKEESNGIENAISASLGTELDKTRMVAVPPTPPGSFSTPRIQTTEWMGEIIDRGKIIVQNVRKMSSVQSAKAEITHTGADEIRFEEGVEVLSLNDVPPIASLSLDSSESAESDHSHRGKIRGEGSVVDEWDA